MPMVIHQAQLITPTTMEHFMEIIAGHQNITIIDINMQKEEVEFQDVQQIIKFLFTKYLYKIYGWRL